MGTKLVLSCFICCCVLLLTESKPTEEHIKSENLVEDSSNSTRSKLEESNEAPSAQHDSKWQEFDEFIEIDGPIESMKVLEELTQSSPEPVESDDEEISTEASGDTEVVSSPAPVSEETSGRSEDPLELVLTLEDLVTSPELFREDEEWEEAVDSLQVSTTERLAEPRNDATSTPDPLELLGSLDPLELAASLDPLDFLGSLDELDEFWDSRKPRQSSAWSRDPLDLLDSSDEQQTDDSPPSTGNGYVLINICNDRYFCPEGKRGPCRRNELIAYGIPPIRMEPKCPNLPSLWAMGCSRMGLADPGQDLTPYVGYCTPQGKSPCHGQPSTHRFSTKTGRCHPVSSGANRDENHCGPGMIFVDVDGVDGECRCQDPESILWPATNTCHRAYSQGPCREGEWLTSSDRGASCERSPCPRQADGRHIYWDQSGQPGCYRSYTRGPCRPGQLFIIESYKDRRATCVFRYDDGYDIGYRWPTRYDPSYDDQSPNEDDDVYPRPSYYYPGYRPWGGSDGSYDDEADDTPPRRHVPYQQSPYSPRRPTYPLYPSYSRPSISQSGYPQTYDPVPRPAYVDQSTETEDEPSYGQNSNYPPRYPMTSNQREDGGYPAPSVYGRRPGSDLEIFDVINEQQRAQLYPRYSAGQSVSRRAPPSRRYGRRPRNLRRF